MEIRKHPMGPVPKWGLYFYWGRGITRVVFNRPLYPAHVDASDSEFQKLLLVSGLVLSWRAYEFFYFEYSCLHVTSSISYGLLIVRYANDGLIILIYYDWFIIPYADFF